MYSTDTESLAWIITPWGGDGPCAAPTCLTTLSLLDPKSAVLELRFPFPLALAQSWFFCSSPAAKIFIYFFTLKLVSFQLACLSQLKGPPLTIPKTQHQCDVSGECVGVRGVGGEREGSVRVGSVRGSVWYLFKWLFKKIICWVPWFVLPPVFFSCLQSACWAFPSRVHLNLPVSSQLAQKWCTLTLRTVWIRLCGRGLKTVLFGVHPFRGSTEWFPWKWSGPHGLLLSLENRSPRQKCCGYLLCLLSCLCWQTQVALSFNLWAAFCSDPEVVEFTGCSHFSPESETLYHPVQITDVSGFQVQYSV